MKDYRVTVKVRNNRLLKAIEEVGGTPGQKWCDENGLGYSRVNDLINMTSSPMQKDGELFRDAARLCEVLNKLPEDLWSNAQLYPLERNFSEIALDYAQVVALLPPEEQVCLPDFSGIENQERTRLVDEALSTLTEREEKVLRMRFHEEMTLDNVAKELGVTRERIRVVEHKALLKLRHPSRASKLIDESEMSERNKEKYKSRILARAGQ